MTRRVSVFFSFLFIVLSLAVNAQNEGTLYFMNSLPQTSYLNPAIRPNYKFSLGLPGSSVSAQYGNNGFALKDFLTEVSTDSVSINVDDLYRTMKDKSYVTQAAQVDIFRLSLQINPRIYLTVNSSAKTYNRVLIPRDAVGLVQGEDALINQNISISPQMEDVTYLETGIAASYNVNEKLDVGLRLKFLKGVTNITTERSQINYVSDGEFVTAAADVTIKSSGIYDPVNDEIIDFDFIQDNYQDYLNNNGFAFDIGGLYKVNEKITVGLSLIDIGGISWKFKTYQHRMDPAVANATFEAPDLDEIINGGEYEGDFDEDAFDPVVTEVSSYRSPLPTKIYLSGSYKLKHNFQAGLLLFSESFQSRFVSGVTASINREFGRRLSAALSYTITQNSFNNLGMGLSLNLPPIQIYFVGDNLLRAPFSLPDSDNLNAFVLNSQYFNLRCGLNFVFNWSKESDKQAHPNLSRY